MTIQQIEYFICVAKHLCFTKAAKELITTQPTVSRQINLLETEIGFPLFIRTRKNVWLTPQGNVLIEELKKVPQIISKAIHEAQNCCSSDLFIGILDEMDCDDYLNEKLEKYAIKAPQVRVSIERRNFADLRAGLENNTYDAIITLDFESRYLKSVSSRKLYPVDAIILMSSQHPLSDKKDLVVNDFKDETFLLPTPDISAGRIDELNAITGKYGYSCKTLSAYPNISSTLIAIRACKGVALLDKSIRGIDSDKYRYITLPQDTAPLSVTLVWKTDIKNTALLSFLNLKD